MTMTMKTRLRITVLPGDGIGPEVTREAVALLRSLAELCGYEFRFEEHAIGGAALRAFGEPFPPATRDACLEADAVLLGAVGAPEFDTLPPAERPEAGLLQLRHALGGYANLRPAAAIAALADCSPLRPEVARGADILIVRELLGGLYFGQPRGFTAGGERAAFNTMQYSEPQVERIARVAFELARRRRRRVTSVDKANILETSQLWRQVVTRTAAAYPDVTLDHMYVDACAIQLITTPRRFDVILTENTFGDILSDEAAVLAGSLGMLPSATLGGAVNLYEPVHGTAPDIAGRGIANPLGAIACAAMLLRHSAHMPLEAAEVEGAIAATLNAGYRTADLRPAPGSEAASTAAMGRAVQAALADVLDRRHAYHAV